ncbi:MAG: cytochrome c [Bacteroidota bacterium]
MKKLPFIQKISIALIMIFGLIGVFSLNSCAPTSAIAGKSGVQLWGENCQRCHNTPSPMTFSPEQWETIGLHMQSRALLTQDEKNKIIDFLKSSR